MSCYIVTLCNISKDSVAIFKRIEKCVIPIPYIFIAYCKISSLYINRSQSISLSIFAYILGKLPNIIIRGERYNINAINYIGYPHDVKTAHINVLLPIYIKLCTLICIFSIYPITLFSPSLSLS